MLAALPADVRMSPSSTYNTAGSTATSGCRRVSSAHSDQCVVARRPLSRPAAASTKAPVHNDTMRAPRSCASRSAVSTSHSAQVTAYLQLVPALDRDDISGGAEREVVPRNCKVGAPVSAEHVADHAELEHRESVVSNENDISVDSVDSGHVIKSPVPRTVLSDNDLTRSCGRVDRGRFVVHLDNSATRARGSEPG